MLKQVIGKVFGSRHERERRRVQPIVDAINEHYERLQGVSEEELRGQTARFRAIVQERTGELERRITELKELTRTTKDSGERDRIDAGRFDLHRAENSDGERSPREPCGRDSL